MRKIAYFALGAFCACAAASIVVHRRVLVAAINGDPLPEPPEWHTWHKGCKKS